MVSHKSKMKKRKLQQQFHFFFICYRFYRFILKRIIIDGAFVIICLPLTMVRVYSMVFQSYVVHNLYQQQKLRRLFWLIFIAFRWEPSFIARVALKLDNFPSWKFSSSQWCASDTGCEISFLFRMKTFT